MTYQIYDYAGVHVTISDDGGTILYRDEGTGPRWEAWREVPRALARLDRIPDDRAQRMIEAAHAEILSANSIGGEG